MEIINSLFIYDFAIDVVGNSYGICGWEITLN